MSAGQFLLDTVFILGVLNPHDHYHDRAMAFLPRLQDATGVWITEAVFGRGRQRTGIPSSHGGGAVHHALLSHAKHARR